MKKYKEMTKEQQTVWKQRVELYGGLLLIFVVLAVGVRWYNTRLLAGEGIAPTPRKAVKELAVDYYAMEDERWAQDALGDTGYLMSQEGSVFCSLSMVLSTCDVTVTPGELNRAFIENDLYVNGKAADLTRLYTLYPGLSFCAPKDFDGKEITDILRKNKACMVRVKKNDSAYWLTVVGATEDDFIVLDPMGGDETHLLSEYGNVFALGIVK